VGGLTCSVEGCERAVKAKGMCNTHYCRDWERRNPERRRANKRRCKYGLSPERFADILTDQGGVCPICGAKDPGDTDHCHETGRVRGILCGKCNRGLGHFCDQPALLRAAIEYLERAA
jgi:hypothetical protein